MSFQDDLVRFHEKKGPLLEVKHPVRKRHKEPWIRYKGFGIWQVGDVSARWNYLIPHLIRTQLKRLLARPICFLIGHDFSDYYDYARCSLCKRKL